VGESFSGASPCWRFLKVTLDGDLVTLDGVFDTILGIGDDIFIPMVGLDANYHFVNVDVVVQFGKREMFD
jgi:hypothetical protein